MPAVTVDRTRRVLEAAGGRPVVWVSSASVYDPRRERGLVGEEHPRAGQLNAYGRTKAQGEALALAAGAVVLRPRAVYGPGDTTLLPRLLSRVRAGTLLLAGPDVRLSLTVVENLTRACLAAAAWAPGAYNIAAAHVAQVLATAAGTEPALSRYAVDQLAHPVVLDPARARAQGWIPHRNLADHLASVTAARRGLSG